MLVPVQAEVRLCRGQELLRRALVEGAPRLGDVGLAELVGGVEALGPGDGVGGHLIQLAEGLLSQKAHQRLVRGVSAHHAALAVVHGLGVLADGQVDQSLQLAALGQLIQGNGHAVGGEELHHLQVALGDGARLVAEQDVQGAGGLDALRLADQHVVVQHLAGVLHQHQGDHQGQALRHGADDDDHRQGHGLHDILDDHRRPGGEVRLKAAGGEDEVAEVHDGDDHGADVAEAGDHVRQLPQLHLQGGVRLILLHLLSHLAHHGGKAHLAHVQHALAVKQHSAPEQGVGVHKGVAGDVLRQGEGRVRRRLGALLRLAVEGGVVHLQGTVDQHAVRRDLVAGLEQDLVPHHHVVHVDDGDQAVAVDLALVLFGAVLQLAVLRIAGHAGLGGDKGHDQHRHDGADGLVDLRVPRDAHDDHQGRDGQQDADHRVLEGLLELRPEGGGLRVRDHVGAVLFPGFFNLFVSQSIKMHDVTPIRCGKGACPKQAPPAVQISNVLLLGPALTCSAGPAPPGRGPWWPGRWR